MVGCELIGTENQLNLCFLWKQKYHSLDPRYPIEREREREYKMGVLGKTISFMVLFTFGIFTKYRIPHNDFQDPFNNTLLIRRCRDMEA